MARTIPVLIGAAALALTGCGVATAYMPTTAAAVHPVSTSKPVLKTHVADDLGRIVVGGNGRAVYVYDVDHQGTKRSACTGSCRAAWPLVTFHGTKKTKVKVSGITGKVGSIAVAKGVRQVTLAGWPLYYYAGDDHAGHADGQGLGGIWWVVNPKGTRIE